MEARGHPEGKKLRELLQGMGGGAGVAVSYCKRSLFKRTAGEATAMLTRLVGVDTHKTNSAEVSASQQIRSDDSHHCALRSL
jgi:hypothetical protein